MLSAAYSGLEISLNSWSFAFNSWVVGYRHAPIGSADVRWSGSLSTVLATFSTPKVFDMISTSSKCSPDTLVQRHDRLSLPTMSRVSCTHYDCFHECLPAHLQALLCSWCLSHNVKSFSSSMMLPFPPSLIKWIIKLSDSNILAEQNRILNTCLKDRFPIRKY